MDTLFYPPPTFCQANWSFFEKYFFIFTLAKKWWGRILIRPHKKAGAKAPANCEKASALSNQPHETSEGQRLLSRAHSQYTYVSANKGKPNVSVQLRERARGQTKAQVCLCAQIYLTFAYLVELLHYFTKTHIFVK